MSNKIAPFSKSNVVHTENLSFLFDFHSRLPALQLEKDSFVVCVNVILTRLLQTCMNRIHMIHPFAS